MGSRLEFALGPDVQIPGLSEPCCLHSVIADAEGTFYCTDEINHQLLAFDTGGGLRWRRATRGVGEGEFWYPKGIDLGWLERGDRIERCMAVCDSWNHRIQLLGLDGSYLGQWSGAGGMRFDDVVDIRFLGSDSVSRSGGGCWLILDRGHHRLVGLDLAGNSRFQVGRPMFASLEDAWPKPDPNCDGIVPPPPNAAIYDPVFMPMRIFGAQQEALYLWESQSGRLKSVCRGHLFPILADPPRGSQWIAADANGLLAHDCDRQVLWYFGFNEGFWRSVFVEGIPIPSGRSSREVWIRKGDIMRLLVADHPLEPGSWTAALSDRRVPEGFVEDRAEATASDLQARKAADLQQLARRVVALGRTALGSAGALDSLRGTLGEFHDELARLWDQYREMLAGDLDVTRDQYLVLLQRRLQSPLYDASLPGQECRIVLKQLEARVDLICSIFMQMLPLRDDYAVACISSERPGAGSPEHLDTYNRILVSALSELITFMTAMSSWSWYARALQVPINPAGAVSGQQSEPTGIEAASWNLIAPPSAMPPGSSGHLRELDCIYLGTGFQTHPVRPGMLARTRDGHILITLHSAQQVLKLNAHYEVLGPLADGCGTPVSLHHPLGVAADNGGRIWISEPSSHAVRIFDPGQNVLLTLEEHVGAPVGLFRPAGICSAHGDRILIADTGNDRVLEITASGNLGVLCGGTGSAPGEFRHPIALCPGKDPETCWVVDRLNHRVQQVRLDGTPMRSVGQAGLGARGLDLPEQAALFEDGSLVVAQSACLRALTIFSPDGEEMDTVFLNYAPKGLLVHDGLLLVCDWFGDHIHVYEIL